MSGSIKSPALLALAMSVPTGLFASHAIAHTDAGFFDSAKAKFGQVANSLAAGAENRRNSAELGRIQVSAVYPNSTCSQCHCSSDA